MIKLNNKGFAVSTILYGTLSLIIIILMLIFGIMKSSKDTNQELVKSVEDKMNKCALSEAILEECYLNGGKCDAREYNNCIGKKEVTFLLAEKAQVGDFVSYDAGTWASTVALPEGDDFKFGGYNAGTSKNNSITCASRNTNKYDGWRILSISGSTVTIIHAGSPFCYYLASNNNTDDKLAYSASTYYFFTGDNSKFTDTSIITSTPYDWNTFVNSDYAESARMANEADLKNSTKNNDSGNILTDLKTSVSNTDAGYVLADLCDDKTCLKGFAKSTLGTGAPTYGGQRILDLVSGPFGARPVVVLKEEIRTTGAITNTYGYDEWVLVK